MGEVLVSKNLATNFATNEVLKRIIAITTKWANIGKVVPFQGPHSLGSDPSTHESFEEDHE